MGISALLNGFLLAAEFRARVLSWQLLRAEHDGTVTKDSGLQVQGAVQHLLGEEERSRGCRNTFLSLLLREGTQLPHA